MTDLPKSPTSQGKSGKNKGEISELLAFLRLLNESKIKYLNEEQQLVEETSFSIYDVIRGAEKADSVTYSLDKDRTVNIIKGSLVLDSIPHDVVVEDDAYITREIDTDCIGGVLDIDTSDIESRYYLPRVNADSASKTDLTLVLYDYHSGTIQKLPFSIKSYLGSAPTLLNSSASTNVIYRINGDLSDEEVNEINSMFVERGDKPKPNIIGRTNAIYSKGCQLEFEKMQSDVFTSNLCIVDSKMPELIGELLIERMRSGCNDFPTLAKRLSERNPLNFEGTQDFYRIKLTRLLMASFTGMVAAKAWDGTEEIHGGYIIVTADKDVLIYSMSNRAMFERYLFNIAYLDNHSVSRSHYASIERDDRGLIFKLNLCVRMKNRKPL